MSYHLDTRLNTLQTRPNADLNEPVHATFIAIEVPIENPVENPIKGLTDRTCNDRIFSDRTSERIALSMVAQLPAFAAMLLTQVPIP
jgi:hypothetical protein